MLANVPEQVHFIGIGGAGMSALAKILLTLGYRVSGSDLAATHVTQRLETLGAKCYLGHDAKNLQDARLVVISSAINGNNPELTGAREKGIPVIHRAELLAWLMTRQKGIAVAGAHGKTTTTSMLALALEKNGLDPTIIIGGELNDIGGNAKLGRGEYVIAESDESDGSFLKLNPLAAIVTNIEDDHLDHYGSLEKIKAAFKAFLGNLPGHGRAVVYSDDPNVREAVADVNVPLITYGVDQRADYTLGEVILNGRQTRGEVFYRGNRLGVLELFVPGRHNLLNALAVVALARWLGLEFAGVAGALKEFRGVGRRFQFTGEAKGVRIFDDYAHHPTEIKATLQAAQTLKPARVIALFQPHRYTRTALLNERFGAAFYDADLIVMTKIYSAGEPPLEGVSTRLILDAVEKHDGRPAVYFPEIDEAVRYLAEVVRPGDLVLTLGAGNIWTAGKKLLAQLA